MNIFCLYFRIWFGLGWCHSNLFISLFFPTCHDVRPIEDLFIFSMSTDSAVINFGEDDSARRRFMLVPWSFYVFCQNEYI